MFYYEHELRRLEWKRGVMGAEAEAGDGEPGSIGGAMGHAGAASREPTSMLQRASSAAVVPISRELHAAARLLDWERKSLAQQVRWTMSETGREELFRCECRARLVALRFSCH